MTVTGQSAAIYVSQYWDAEACVPENWKYVPSTYGVKGAHLVGTPAMKLWSELQGNWDNPGRRGGIDFGKCGEIKEDIEEFGINTAEGSMIYWEAKTDNKINAFHRETVSADLDIAGWMGQAVRFDDEVARIRFACKSNNRKDLVHNNSSPEDVETSVRDVTSILGTYTSAAVKAEVNDLGAHLSPTTRDKIVKAIITDYTYDDKMEQVDRYTAHNAASVPNLLETKIVDPWVSDYWKNDEEKTLAVHMVNFEARIGSVLSSARDAIRQDVPLSFVFSVGIPKGKETLQSKRQKVWTTFVAGLEERLLVVGDHTDRWRGQFPWNHPDAEHRFVPQAKGEDKETLIKIPNREFN